MSGRTTDVIQLMPAVPDLPFEKAVIWLDRESALPRRLEIHEQSGATRTLNLTRIRVNEPVPANGPLPSRSRAASAIVDQ